MKRPVRAIGYGIVFTAAVIASERNPAEVPLVIGLGVPAMWLADRVVHRRTERCHDWLVAEATRTIAGARDPDRVTRQVAAAVHWRLGGGKGPLPHWIKEMP